MPGSTFQPWAQSHTKEKTSSYNDSVPSRPRPIRRMSIVGQLEKLAECLKRGHIVEETTPPYGLSPESPAAGFPWEGSREDTMALRAKNDELNRQLSECEKDRQDAEVRCTDFSKQLEECRSQLDWTKGELFRLWQENCRLLVDKKAPETRMEAELLLADIIKQLNQLQVTNPRDNHLVRDLKFRQAETLIFLEKYSEAEPVAQHVLDERRVTSNGSDEYKSSYRQVLKILLIQGKQDKRKLKDAQSMLRLALPSDSNWDDWSFELGDKLISISNPCEDYTAFSCEQLFNAKKRRYEEHTGSQNFTNMVNSGFRLAEILKDKPLLAARRLDIMKELWSYWNAGVPEEVVSQLLTAGYEVGYDHYLRKEWNDAENVLYRVLEGMRSVSSQIGQPSNREVLGTLASVYRNNGTQNIGRAETVLHQLYEELKSSSEGEPGYEDALRYGFELSKMIERQPGRTLAAAVIMKDVLDAWEKALNRGKPVTRALLETAFFYGYLLKKLAQDPHTHHTIIGDRATLLYMAARAFGIVWRKSASNNAELFNALNGEQILKSGLNYLTCLVDYHECVRVSAIEHGREIWAVQKRQGQENLVATLDFGYDLGMCLKAIGNTDEAAVDIFQDIWSMQISSCNISIERKLRYGDALGACLYRLAIYDDAKAVFAEIWKEGLQSRVLNNLSICAYNYGCCLLELGDYSMAQDVLATIQSPSEDDSGIPAQRALEKARKALEQIKEYQDEKARNKKLQERIKKIKNGW